jgi:RNA polymerase sigma-70 factor (ECF subfamily)
MYGMETLSATTVAEAGPVDFDAFYATEYRPLLRLAFALTGDAGTAEELVQEAMLRALRHWRKVSSYDKPGAWARRVLLNLATSRARRKASEARARARLEAERPPLGPGATDVAAVRDAIRTLPAEEAHVVALHYLEDMSVVDIANVLERPEGTVKTLLYRARKSLATQLAEEDES